MRKRVVSLAVVGLWAVLGAWLVAGCGGGDGSGVVLESISPSSGAIGVEVTLHGSGFTAEGNDVGFRNEQIEFAGRHVGYVGPLRSPDGRTIRFTLTDTLGACAFSQLATNEACPGIGLPLPPGPSEVFVVNSTGESEGVTFTVTEP